MIFLHIDVLALGLRESGFQKLPPCGAYGFIPRMLIPARRTAKAMGGVPQPSLVSLQVFGFLNLVLWVGNLWFVFKETGWAAPFLRAPPGAPEKQPAPGDAYGDAGYGQGPGGYGPQDSYGPQGGYQPDYGQPAGGGGGGYGPQGDYGQQGYGPQGAPTSFSNQM